MRLSTESPRVKSCVLNTAACYVYVELLSFRLCFAEYIEICSLIGLSCSTLCGGTRIHTYIRMSIRTVSLAYIVSYNSHRFKYWWGRILRKYTTLFFPPQAESCLCCHALGEKALTLYMSTCTKMHGLVRDGVKWSIREISMYLDLHVHLRLLRIAHGTMFRSMYACMFMHVRIYACMRVCV